MGTDSDWYDVAWKPHKDMTKPLHLKKPRRIFVNSMSDTFHPDVPFEFIDKIFAVAALCPQHTFMIVTSRPERMAEYLASFDGDVWERMEKQSPSMEFRYEDGAFADITTGEHFLAESNVGRLVWPLKNCWLGAIVEDQATADERIPHLLACPAVVRFLSCEPLLGPVDLGIDGLARDPKSGEVHMRCEHAHRKKWPPPIELVIVGGESGKNARPCNVEWIRSIVQQCKAAAVPCFVDRLGSNCIDPAAMGLALISPNRYSRWYRDPNGANPLQWPDDLRVFEWPRRNTGDHA